MLNEEQLRQRFDKLVKETMAKANAAIEAFCQQQNCSPFDIIMRQQYTDAGIEFSFYKKNYMLRDGYDSGYDAGYRAAYAQIADDGCVIVSRRLKHDAAIVLRAISEHPTKALLCKTLQPAEDVFAEDWQAMIAASQTDEGVK